MAFLTYTHSSNALGAQAEFYMIIPENDGTQTKPPKVLYLLHGLSDNHTSWVRLTSIERYAREKNMIVIMPNAARSFYTDMFYGRNYYTYISKELPEYIQSVFKLDHSRENTFIAGLSMGGYGAVKLALRNPDKYCAVASFSGVLDVAARFNNTEWQRDVILITGGKDVKNTENDLLYLLDKYKDGSLKKPAVFQACGTEDFLYNNNITFKNKIENMGFNYKYEEAPGCHYWGFWDVCIQHDM